MEDELLVMKRIKRALESLKSPEARHRVLNYVQQVIHSEMVRNVSYATNLMNPVTETKEVQK